MKYFLILIFPAFPLFSQDNTDLFNVLHKQDSLLFNVGFNECNTGIFNDLIASEFIFYHDQSGITPDKESFIRGMREGLCAMDYRAIRELDTESLRVYPLYDDGQIYAALQTGFHKFYALRENTPRRLTSTALFNHLWILEDGSWKLKHVISYDHIPQND